MHSARPARVAGEWNWRKRHYRYLIDIFFASLKIRVPLSHKDLLCFGLAEEMRRQKLQPHSPHGMTSADTHCTLSAVSTSNSVNPSFFSSCFEKRSSMATARSIKRATTHSSLQSPQGLSPSSG